MWPLDGRAVVQYVTCRSAAVHVRQSKNELYSLALKRVGLAHIERRLIMTLRNALIAAAVLVLSAPVVPALAHDDEDSGYNSHDQFHDQLSGAHERAHEDGFESGAEHRAYHRALRDFHDDAHGYERPRYNSYYNDYYPRPLASVLSGVLTLARPWSSHAG